MKYFAVIGAAACMAASPLAAQDVTTTAAAPAEAPVAVAPPPVVRTLPAGTIVTMTPLQEITSKKVEVGDTFSFTVINDVVENGQVVIPRGSTASGKITWKTGRAIGGKSGKFDVEFQSVAAGGRSIPLMGTHRQEGRGNTVGALFGSLLISGRSAVMLPGQQVTAMTKEPTSY